MTLEIISPEAALFKGVVSSVKLPGIDGSFQILNNHAPIVSTLVEGIVDVEVLNVEYVQELEPSITKVTPTHFTFAIESGTIEMNNNKIIVLVD